MRREDGVGPKRRRSEAPENAAFTVDRDDRDQRQHRACRDQERRQDRQIDGHGLRRIWWNLPRSPAEQPAEDDKDQHRDADRSKYAQRLADENLDLEPGQFEESA